MDLSDLRTEVAARGFDYIPTTRIDYFINRAYQELCEEEEWPFLYDVRSGVAPLTIDGLRTIEQVIDRTQNHKLQPLNYRHWSDSLYPDYAEAPEGVPLYYAVGASFPNEPNTVFVHPPNTTDEIVVYFWNAPDELTATTDEPVLPSRFHHLLVDGAVVYCYIDSDEPDMALQVTDLWESGKQRMRDSLLARQQDRRDNFMVKTQYNEDD